MRCHYAYQMLSGDGQITTRLNALQHFWNNRAGVMIRGIPGAQRQVRGPGFAADAERIDRLRGRRASRAHEHRSHAASRWAPRDQAMPNWLRLSRAGDTFSAFISADGSNWLPVATATVAMNTSVLIGASVASAQYGVWTTASFDNVSVGAGSPPSCGSVALDRTSFYAGGPEAGGASRSRPRRAAARTAVSDSPWLVVRSTVPSPPIGGGTVQIQALSNTSGSFRVGHVTIARRSGHRFSGIDARLAFSGLSIGHAGPNLVLCGRH